MAAKPTPIHPQRDLLTLDDLIALTGWRKPKRTRMPEPAPSRFPRSAMAAAYYFLRRAYEAWRDGWPSRMTPTMPPETTR